MVRELLLRVRNLGQLFRFYQAAAINTAFGFSTFSLLVWLGLNIYLAQITSHVFGVTFNYFTYSRHVFRDRQGSKARFVAAYGVNYLINLAFLAFFDLFIHSPYLTGLLATICASLTNYLSLRHVVFRRKSAT